MWVVLVDGSQGVGCPVAVGCVFPVVFDAGGGDAQPWSGVVGLGL